MSKVIFIILCKFGVKY